MNLYEGRLNTVNTIESTNKYFVDRRLAFKNNTALYTKNQTEGIGSRGRTWQKENGLGLALSMVYSVSTQKLPQVTLIAGLAVVKMLREECALSTQLKWSNDVLAGRKKIAGILCESVICAKTARVVIGIGLNVLQKENDFTDLPYATSLYMEQVKTYDIDILAAKLYKILKDYLSVYFVTGFDEKLKKEYEENSYTIGKEIKVVRNNTRLVGKAVGIAQDGGLVCEINGKTEKLNSDEVSVRGLYGYAD